MMWKMRPKAGGVAAPVYNGEGKAVASVGVAGGLSQIEFGRMDAIGKLVRNYAGQVSGRLGYTLKVVQSTEQVAS